MSNPKAAIYCRISRDADQRGLGVERQRVECEELAERLKAAVVDVFTDNDLSAFSGKRRPEYRRLLQAIEDGQVDLVITWHPDRLHRSPIELEEFIDVVEAAGAKVATVQGGDYDLSTASGRTVARIVGAIARGESEHKSERIKLRVGQLVAAGSPPGGRAPFGYRRDRLSDGEGTYVRDETEAPILGEMVEWALDGRSMLWIARQLNERGVATRSGSVWNHGVVGRLLKTPALAALRVHHGEVAGEGNWEPLIARATWEQLQQVLVDPARKRRRPESFYPLSGVLRSPSGVRLIGRATPSKGGVRRCYVSPVGSPAPFVQVGSVEVEELLAEIVLQRFDKVTLPIVAETVADSPDIADIERELDELAKLRGEDVISLREWVAAREPMLARLVEAKAAVIPSRPPGIEDGLLDSTGVLRDRWNDLSDAQRRRIFAVVLESVTVRPVGRGGRWIKVEDRVEPPVWRV